MRQVEFVAARSLDLVGRLRTATAGSHRELESALDLLTPPLRQERFTAVLAGFYGFHSVWERAVCAVPGLEQLMRQRSRLGRLHADLTSLGKSGEQIEALPRCLEAAKLARSLESALGSLYVLEGSTLGGQVIDRALEGLPWIPPGGLTYFNPYGERTGAMWRTFRTAAELICPTGAEADVESGAIRTFELLTRWLPRGRR